MAFSNRINWCNYGQYKIIDISRKEHERVVQCLWEYFRNHRIVQLLQMPQEADIEQEFDKIVKHILQNESSFMVVDEELEDIKGVALLMGMSKSWRSWTWLQLLLANERFKELGALMLWCLQQEIIQIKDNPGGDSLHIFACCLCQELNEDEEFLPHFFGAICEVARHMHLPRVTVVSWQQHDHSRLKSVGFVEMVRIVYSLFMYKNRRPFDRLRDINEMYGIYFEKKVPPLIPYQEMFVRHAQLPVPVPAKEDVAIMPKESKNGETPNEVAEED